MSDILNGLNPQQKEAVMHTEGPLLILAGAGSGKTRVLTHRIAYLVENGFTEPEGILALTFTNKAAKEMKERAASLTGKAADKMLITTFHSACVRFLKNRMMLLGYKRGNFVIYDTDEQKKIIRTIFEETGFQGRYPDIKVYDVISFISKQKEKMLGPYELESIYPDYPLITVYKEYERILKKNNALDFADLLWKTVQLFENYPHILADKHQNLCVVGDDDQSIYSFRGADIRNILEFEKEFQNTKVIKLEENYRSTKNILSAANAVISHNQERKEKKLWTQGEEGSKLRTITLPDATTEAKFIVSEIERMHNREKADYKDFAILYRTNAQSRLFEQCLTMKDIPYRLVGALSFFERKEVKDMLAYLRVLINPDDDFGLERIINVPRRGIGAVTIKKLKEYAFRNNRSLYDAACSADEILSKTAADKLKGFAAMLRKMTEESKYQTADMTIKMILHETDFFADYPQKSEELEERTENVYELINMATDYSRKTNHEGAEAIEGFLTESALTSGIDSLKDDEDGVVLMTLHGSKGLEFPHVFMAGMEENTFPGYRAINSTDPAAMEEERRLCYVGITRARKTLTLTSAAQRMNYGKTYAMEVSRFIDEIPRDLVDHMAVRW